MRVCSWSAIVLAGTLLTAGSAIGCGSSTTGGGNGTTGSSSAGSADSPNPELVKNFLVTPADAKSFGPKPSAPVTAPTSKQPISLPYKDVLPVPDGPIGDPDKTYTICFSQSLTGSTWSAAQKDSVSIEAARHPNIKILATNTDDPLEQVKQLETCMARNPDAVLVWPHSVAPLTPEVEKIADSGVPIVGMERTVATKDYSTWVYLDAEKASVQLADAVGKKLNGKGIVAETDGAPGTSPQILRRVFFRDALAKNYPDIKVIDTPPSNWDRNQAYKVALDFLQSHDDIDAWYVQYSADALGVRQAMEELGRTDIPIFTVADGRVAVQNIIDGKLYAVSPWTPVHGDVALRAAIYHLENKDVPKDILLTQPDIITPENAKEALKQEWPG